MVISMNDVIADSFTFIQRDHHEENIEDENKIVI